MNHSVALALESVFWRALATRIIRVGLPSCIVTMAFWAKTKRARGRENRAKISPVMTASNDIPIKISTVATT